MHLLLIIFPLCVVPSHLLNLLERILTGENEYCIHEIHFVNMRLVAHAEKKGELN